MNAGNTDPWASIEILPARHITMHIDDEALAIRLAGSDWAPVRIIPPLPAGEDVEYDLAEINVAIQAGENLTWERIGPNLCRIVRAGPQEFEK